MTKLVKGTPLSVPINVDVNGNPTPVSTLVISLPCAFVKVSNEVKGMGTPDAVSVA